MRRLERDILPHGVTYREAAEILIQLDRAVSRADRTWNDWFVVVMVDYVVWSERPTAIVNEEAALRLSPALEQPVPTPNGRRLVRAIVSEAERVHERLTAQLNVSDPAGTEVLLGLAPACDCALRVKVEDDDLFAQIMAEYASSDWERSPSAKQAKVASSAATAYLAAQPADRL